MRFLASLAFGLVLATSTGAWAETPAPATAAPAIDPQTQAEARRFLEVGGGESAFIMGATSAFHAAAEAQGVHFTDDQWRRVRGVLEAHFADAAHAFTEEMVTYYATHYRLEDLSAANAYYETPAGRRYVAAAVDFAMPLVGYLVSGGRLPLPELRDEAVIPRDRLDAAHRLATLMAARLGELQTLQLEQAGFGADKQIDYYGRGLADAMTLEELTAAVDWAASEPSQRLEGPSLDRDQAIQVAALHVQSLIDGQAIGRDVQAAMQDHRT